MARARKHTRTQCSITDGPRFEVLTDYGFWLVTPCSLAVGYQSFCLCLQVKSAFFPRHSPKDHSRPNPWPFMIIVLPINTRQRHLGAWKYTFTDSPHFSYKWSASCWNRLYPRENDSGTRWHEPMSTSGQYGTWRRRISQHSWHEETDPAIPPSTYCLTRYNQ
jgi:hypothetical protein